MTLRRQDHDEARAAGTAAGRERREILLFGLAVAVLVVFGICFIYSACYVSSAWPVRSQWKRQLFWIFPGMLVGLTAWRLDYRRLRPLLFGAYGVSVLLLGVVLFWGVEIGGARRWFRLFGLLVQPAEFARFLTIAVFAAWLTSPSRRRRSRWAHVLFGAGLAGLPLVLIAVEPSLGNALTLGPPLAAMIAVERLSPRLLRAALIGLAILCLAYIAGLYRVRRLGLHPRAIAAAATPYWPWRHHVRRIAFFLSDTGDWNDRQSLLAITGGGAWGKGFRQGMMKMLGYLPRPVAPTDFIFSVIGEEAGFFTGALPILLLYGLVAVLMLRWGERSPDPFGRALCVGFAVLFCTHVGLNIGMTVRLIPIVGLPLPFLSYGGSFLICCLGACGLVCGVARRNAVAADLPEALPEAPASFWEIRVVPLDSPGEE